MATAYRRGLRRALGRGKDLREGSPSSPSRRSQGARQWQRLTGAAYSTLPQVPRCPTMATAYRQRPTTRFRPWGEPAGGFPRRWQRLTGSGLQRALGRGKDLREGSPSSPSRRSQGARQWQRLTGSGLRRALGRGENLREGSPSSPSRRSQGARQWQRLIGSSLQHPPAGPKVPDDGNGLPAAAYNAL